MENKTNYYKIDSKEEKDLCEMYNITRLMHESFFSSLYPTEIYNYISYFLSTDFLKNKIEIDKHLFYLIKNKDNVIGFFEFSYFDNILLFCNIFIEEKERNKKTATHVFEFLKQKSKELNLEKIWAFIYQKNTLAQDIFTNWNFNKTDTQARYLGSDIFLFENLYEYTI